MACHGAIDDLGGTFIDVHVYGTVCPFPPSLEQNGATLDAWLHYARARYAYWGNSSEPLNMTLRGGGWAVSSYGGGQPTLVEPPRGEERPALPARERGET